MNIDTVDALQGRGKDSTHSSYFMEDTSKLKEEYINHLSCLLVNTNVNELDIKSPEYTKLEVENTRLKEYIEESMSRIQRLEELFKTRNE